MQGGGVVFRYLMSPVLQRCSTSTEFYLPAGGQPVRDVEASDQDKGRHGQRQLAQGPGKPVFLALCISFFISVHLSIYLELSFYMNICPNIYLYISLSHNAIYRRERRTLCWPIFRGQVDFSLSS